MALRNLPFTRKAQTIWLLAVFILQQALVVDPVIAAPFAAKRDDVTTLFASLNSSLEAKISTVSQSGLNLLDEILSSLVSSSYAVTQSSKDTLLRAANLDIVRANFLYGSAVGGGPSYPSGLLGIAKSINDIIVIQGEALPVIAWDLEDYAAAAAHSSKYDGLETLEDYTQLYDAEWMKTMPSGTYLGVETNYTQDLFFSMQRLSSSPYKIRRLSPGSDNLQFTISDDIATKLSGMTLDELFQEGRLFYADYTDLKDLDTINGRYAAACDAYFYINASSGDFLPLAIRTNVGSNLVYTPLDSAGDWMLAKMMYNANDFWFAQWNHLAGTHQVLQIVWMAAIRSISQEHPVFAILDRITYQNFAIQMLAEIILFSSGGAIDLIFPYSGSTGQSYSSNQYSSAGAGQFQANYFLTDLRTRGLINPTVGPDLKSFPFYEDGGNIYNAIHTFMTSFVQSYYTSDAMVAADREIQTWASECNGAAKVVGFPSKISTISALVDALTHMAHLASTAHHTVNTNELLQVSSAFPISPAALYSPLPTEKSADTDPVKFLPPLTKALEQFVVSGIFARPQLAGTNRTIIHMFDDQSMLGRMNSKTQAANSVFVSSMQSFSASVSSRAFDSQGLSQGMPFIWTALDPNVAPYSAST